MGICEILSVRYLRVAFVAIALLLCDGCTNSVNGVSIDQYNASMASIHIEVIHMLDINHAGLLKENTEGFLKSDIRLLWNTIIRGDASAEDVKTAYALLRLIAVQNEKFPIPAIKGDEEAAKILSDAIQNDVKHAEMLRNQDWSKPKWVH
jgi:hypothetical protein